MKNIYVLFSITLLLLLLLPGNADAIPAFARKYNLSCTTCHSPAPRLKPYGEEFAGNGFTLNDQEAPRYFTDTGDELLSLLKELPLSIRLEGYLTYNKANEQRSDFSAPYNIKLISGGEIAKDISYYFYFFFSERGEVAGVEDAFVMFNNVFGTELDVTVGQFQVSDPIFKRELRLTFQDYEVYRPKVGTSTASMTYDRGVMLSYGFDTGTDIVVEMLNGNGIGAGDGNQLFDNDKNKNFAGRISQDIGEYFRIGGFGYYGTDEHADSLGGTIKNNVEMYGPDFTINLDGKAALNAQFLYRKDGNVFAAEDAAAPTADVVTQGILAELVITPDGDLSRWYGVGMFNWVDSDLDALDKKLATVHGGYLIRRNFRVTAELSYDFLKEYTTFGVGFISAF